MTSQETTNEEDVMKDITDPRETDVLCGRGGAALRHAGNQTYRRLVNLNKGLYITCMKTEKLKISRSIVAAIREQKGRFLEREVKKGVWFDIGDKKAVEKTSQALREGQPKLRKKMVAMGQIPSEQAKGGIDPVPASVQQQLLQQYGNGIYNTRGAQPNSNNVMNGTMNGNMNMLMNNGMNMNNVGRMGSGNSYSNMLDSMQQQQQEKELIIGRNLTSQLRNSMAQMPPPPLRTLSNGTSVNSMNSMNLLRRMSNATSVNSMNSVNRRMSNATSVNSMNSVNNMNGNNVNPLRTLSNGTSVNSMNNANNMNRNNDLTILQHLSLDTNPQSVPSWSPSMGSVESLMTMSTSDVPQMLSRRNLLRPYNRNPSYGSHNNNNNNINNNSTINTMTSITSNSSCSNSSNNNDLSDFALNGNGRGIDRSNMIEPNFLCEKIGSFDPTEQPFRQQQQLQQQQQQQQQQLTRTRDHAQNGLNENNNNNNMNNINNMNDQRPTGPSVNDRRRCFARMKYARKNSPRNLSSRSINDGMPDIHMVDSQFSLLSNLSAHGSKHRGQNAVEMDISKHGVVRKDSMGSEYIGVGSRRSLMSGLSKTSGHSTDISNTFSNMSRKITGTNHAMSSRSLTMSEFSGVDEEFGEEDFNFDIPTQRNP